MMNKSALKDPQSWISLIGVVTVIGLCAGVFEPSNAPAPSTQAGAPIEVQRQQPTAVARHGSDELLAMNGH